MKIKYKTIYENSMTIKGAKNKEEVIRVAIEEVEKLRKENKGLKNVKFEIEI